MMRRISVANIILVHRKLIDQTGGSHGVRDINLVDSAVSRAFGFIDGNKRVGIAVMLLLLKLNGYTLQYSQEELIVMGISIADGSMDEFGIKEWINRHKKS